MSRNVGAKQMLVPERCNQYTLSGCLAEGSVCDVFLARQGADGDWLAIKRARPRFCRDRDFVLGFVDEARIAQQLVHPNICRVYEQGQADGLLYLVMEYVHGFDLARLHQALQAHGRRLPYWAAAWVVAQIAHALDYAHRLVDPLSGEGLEIVHRDVSPQNILLSLSGVPKLIDFGIAHARERLSQTLSGKVKGRCCYMSPEQATGGVVDGRSDIYSLGVVLYELTTGRLPYRGEDDLSILRAVADGRYVKPRKLEPRMPRRLAATIHKALAKKPSRRFASARAFAQALEAVIAAEHPNAVSAHHMAHVLRRHADDGLLPEPPAIEAATCGLGIPPQRPHLRRVAGEGTQPLLGANKVPTQPSASSALI